MQEKGQSLGSKVVMLVSLLTVLAFAGLFTANFYSQKNATMEQIRHNSAQTSKLLQLSINEPMVGGDNEGTTTQFETLSRNFKDIRVQLTNHEGEITYSTEPQNIRRDATEVMGETKRFPAMLRQGLSAGVAEGEVLELNGKPHFVEVEPIKNSPECYHCHGDSKPVLGAMVMSRDIGSEIAMLNDSLLKNALYSVVGLVVLLFFLLLFMRKAVIKRILDLTRGTEEVRKGDLSVHFNSKGGDELAVLGGNLTAMVESIKEQMDQEEEARLFSKKLAEYRQNEVNNLSTTLQSIAQGDLTATYRTAFAGEDLQEAQQSFLEIQTALNDTTKGLAEMISDMKDNAQALAAAAEQLSTVSARLSENSGGLSHQAANVAGATEQISMNINSMAAATEEMSVNVNTVSSTAEEMSHSMASVATAIQGIRESNSGIAQRSEEGSRVTAEAMGLSGSATDTMHLLGEAAQEIGKVTAVIKRIAEQTNLLALNATIEAASAGDAGKGFAVVAHEIKELANQSAKAAEDIALKIEGVQGNTAGAVKVISDVAAIIGTINESVGVIAQSVEDQTEAVNQISVNVSETAKGSDDIAVSIAELAKGSNDISRNAGEVAKGANEVAGNILGVSKSAEQGNAGAKEVTTMAAELARVAGELQNMASRFKASEDD